MQHIIRTSTDLLPILCPDLYESAISPSTVFGWKEYSRKVMKFMDKVKDIFVCAS